VEKAEINRPEDIIFEGDRQTAKLLPSKVGFSAAFGRRYSPVLAQNPLNPVHCSLAELLSSAKPGIELNLTFPVYLVLRIVPMFACGGFPIFGVEGILSRTSHFGAISVSPNLGKLGT